MFFADVFTEQPNDSQRPHIPVLLRDHPSSFTHPWAKMNRIMTLRVSDAVTLLALIALCFPTLALIQLGASVVFPHYMALAIAIPVLFALRPWTLKPVLPVLGMILLSTALNINTVSIPIAIFHSLHLVAIALLAGVPGGLPLRFAKATIMIYSITILLTQILVVLGLGGLVEGLLVQDEGLTATRVGGFATEPSYAAMILLILSRFVIVCDADWLGPRRLAVVLGALVATLSLFALLSAVLIIAIYLLERSNMQAMLAILIGGIVLLIGLSLTEFLTVRLNSLDMSRGMMGLGSGAIRLLPYQYLADILPKNPWPLFVGAGAGALEPIFFEDVGRYYTIHSRLTPHMAGPLYDYGLVAILPILLLWNRPGGLVARAIFIIMALIVMLNTGIGTYLFILFGIFALLEQKHRSK